MTDESQPQGQYPYVDVRFVQVSRAPQQWEARLDPHDAVGFGKTLPDAFADLVGHLVDHAILSSGKEVPHP